jgi:antitoxin (DNA-binding transcriptional repressor) of toxin-antitoxin stability system
MDDDLYFIDYRDDMGEPIDILTAEKNLDRLIDRAAAGEDVVITRAGKPVVRLTYIGSCVGEGPRQPGLFAGLHVPDTFFDPLPPDELSAWE